MTNNAITSTIIIANDSIFHISKTENEIFLARLTLIIIYNCTLVNDVRPKNKKRQFTDHQVRAASDSAISIPKQPSGCCLTDRDSVSSVLANH